MHAITCSWDTSGGTPWGASATAVAGFVRVLCSDALDDANTNAQLQRFVGGVWADHGEAVTSYNKGPTIHVTDSAAKSVGDWYYRVKGTHFGQHGNVWVLPTYYTPPRSLLRTK